MRFLVVGPGAMGLLFSGRLKRAGFDVTLLDYKEQRAKVLNKKGISVKGISGDLSVRIPVKTKGPFKDVDFALICVKAYSTKIVASALREWLPDKTILVTLQNGIGNMETLIDIFGTDRVLGGVTSEGATLMESGTVRHAGTGETIIGPDSGEKSKARILADSLKKAGFSVSTHENLQGLIWGKLIINVGINPFSAILRVKNGYLPQLVKDLMEDAVNEAVSVSLAKGISLPYEMPFEKVLEVCRRTSGNIASMLQDVLKKRRTEIEYINGAIVREGKRYGISTPINNALTSLVLALEKSYIKRVNL